MSNTLRTDLLDAKLVSEGWGATDGRVVKSQRTNTEAADLAVAVVAAWLRRKAAAIRPTDRDELGQTARTVRLIRAEAIDKLADSLEFELKVST